MRTGDYGSDRICIFLRRRLLFPCAAVILGRKGLCGGSRGGEAMTLQQLRYVTAVADTGAISRAAQKFYVSQPSITAAIRPRSESGP